MRSVFIDSTLTTPPFGGATTFLAELCFALAQRGDHVTVVSRPGSDDSVVRRLRAGGVDVRLDLWRATHLPEERAKRLATWLDRERANIFVISISPDAGWLALPLLEPSIGTVSIAHADGPAFYEPLKHYAAFIDCAVGVSESIQRQIVDQCGVSPERARYVPYGVPSLSRAEVSARCEVLAPDAPLRIAYLGRVVQGHKRVLDLVPLAAELKRREMSFELHVLGDGPERQLLEGGFRKEGVSGDVTLWGWLTPAEVRQRLKELDAVVLLSDSEGLPLALLESMGHGVVPVVTNLEGGLTEVVIDGVNGLLAPVNDAPAFADRLQMMAHDRRKLSRMRQAAWQTSQNYSLERMVQNYVGIFQELIEATPTRRQAADGRVRAYPVMPSCKSKYPFWLRKIKSYVMAVGSRS